MLMGIVGNAVGNHEAAARTKRYEGENSRQR